MNLIIKLAVLLLAAFPGPVPNQEDRAIRCRIGGRQLSSSYGGPRRQAGRGGSGGGGAVSGGAV